MHDGGCAYSGIVDQSGTPCPYYGYSGKCSESGAEVEGFGEYALKDGRNIAKVGEDDVEHHNEV